MSNQLAGAVNRRWNAVEDSQLSVPYYTPPLSAPLAHPVPHQPVAQFMPNNSALAVHEDGKIYSLVIDLMDPNSREGALLELSKKREQYDDLALVLWHSFGALPYPPFFFFSL
jgi:hypothetical protein